MNLVHIQSTLLQMREIAILFLQIFSDDWAIWSVRAAALRKSQKPTVPLTITVTSWSLNSIRMPVLFKLRSII